MKLLSSKWNGLKVVISILVVVLAPLSDIRAADYLCSSRMMNPVTDVCWQCIFPIKLGGVEIAGGGAMEDVPDATSSVVCTCPMASPPYWRVGITISYWEPAAYIETVRSPWCLPALGFSLNGANIGLMTGTNSSAGYGGAPHTFAHSHYFIYPIFALMNIMADLSCVETGDFAPAFMTEIYPTFNDDLAMAFTYPEAVLFGNPIAQMACIADSVTANAGYPLAPLFWCMGSWGSAYPLTNNIDNSSLVEANAAIAARTIYKLSRMLLLHDRALNLCASTMTPIWYKPHFRLQLAMPVRDYTCHPIGRSGLIWSYGKNPPLFPGSDNFVWIVFKKKACCAF